MSSLPSGSRIGHFRMVGRLGKGGMGLVYRARDEQLARDVAEDVLRGGAPGRSFFGLALLVPGVTTYVEAPTAVSDFNINGERNNSNNVTIVNNVIYRGSCQRPCSHPASSRARIARSIVRPLRRSQNALAAAAVRSENAGTPFLARAS